MKIANSVILSGKQTLTLKRRLSRFFIAAFLSFGVIISLAIILLLGSLNRYICKDFVVNEKDRERDAIRAGSELPANLLAPLWPIFDLFFEENARLWSSFKLQSKQDEHLAYLRIFIDNAEIATVFRDNLTFPMIPHPTLINRGLEHRDIGNRAEFGSVKPTGSFYEFRELLYLVFPGGLPFPVGELIIGFSHNLSDEEARSAALHVIGNQGSVDTSGRILLANNSSLIAISKSMHNLRDETTNYSRDITIFNHNGMPIFSSFIRNVAEIPPLPAPIQPHAIVSASKIGNKYSQTSYDACIPLIHRAAVVGTAQIKVNGDRQFANKFRSELQKFYVRFLSLTVGLTVLMLLGGIFFIIRFQRRIVCPIRDIANAMENFVHGQQTDPIHLQRANELAADDHFTTELEQICSSYARMVSSLESTQQQLINSERQALLGIIAAGVAHELKNALTPAVSRADTMLAQQERNRLTPDDLVSGLQIILTSTRRASDLSVSLNAFAKPIDEQSRYAFDLNEAVRDALALSRDLLCKEKIIAYTDFRCLQPIKGLPKEVQQALLNFVLNSKDAILEAREKQHRSAGNIHISTFLEKDAAVLKISDDGCGMTEATKSRLFEPFYTTKEAGKGTGLGMAICKTIFDGHGAPISAESEWGKGTTIFVRFPLSIHSETSKSSAY